MTLPFASMIRSQQSGENWWTQQASKRIPRHKALHCLARARSHKQDSCQTLQRKGCSSRKGDHHPWWDPVFRLSAMAKIFTSIINNRLCDYLIEKGIITQQQCGFQKKHGTQDSIFIWKAVIDNLNPRNQITFYSPALLNIVMHLIVSPKGNCFKNLG